MCFDTAFAIQCGLTTHITCAVSSSILLRAHHLVIVANCSRSQHDACPRGPLGCCGCQWSVFDFSYYTGVRVTPALPICAPLPFLPLGGSGRRYSVVYREIVLLFKGSGSLEQRRALLFKSGHPVLDSLERNNQRLDAANK